MAKKQVTYQFAPTTIKAVKAEAKRRSTKENKIAAQVVAEELILKGLKK